VTWAVGLMGSAGWVVAVVALVWIRSRLSLVADAEHELRGAAAAIGLAAERMKAAGATRAFASMLDVQLARAAAGLADLERARRRPPGGASRVGRTSGSGAAGAHSARLAQVVANLVANATQHGAGPVEISWRPTAAGARLEIRNPNRPPELDRLAAERAEAGRGRGLGIAARAARDLGGSLRVESGAEGTAATLELPAPESRGTPGGSADRGRLAA
jgi:C4-dicarboxylate-specific signal transduction histidine kinase